jgi:hypothetical protein
VEKFDLRLRILKLKMETSTFQKINFLSIIEENFLSVIEEKSKYS